MIRPEHPDDHDAIAALTLAAFETVPYGDGTEAGIIAGLRAAGDLVLAYVATDDSGVIGQVSVSPARIADAANWFGIGPIAVRPDRHGNGVGTALMNAVIATMTERGAAGLVLAGSPRYYNRFGFAACDGLTYLDVPTYCVMRRVLCGPDAIGEITFAPALQGA